MKNKEELFNKTAVVIAFILTALVMLCISQAAYADTATVTFTPPTEREDTTPLPAAEIGGYNVFINGVPVDTLNPLLPTATGFTLDLQPGVHTVTVTTFDTDGRESVMSVPVEIAVPFNPKAPMLDGATLTRSADLNIDGVVNFADFSIFKQQFYSVR